MRLSAAVLFAVLAASTSLSAEGPQGGPYVHRIGSATSADGLTWTRDEGTRIEHASVPCAVALADRILLYYVDADRGAGMFESVGCASSTDGIRFEKQPFTLAGLPSRKALDPSVVRDLDGKFRLYYYACEADPGSRGDHPVRLAVSDDGVRFVDRGEAFRREGLVDPDVFMFGDRWFMYVFGKGDTVIAQSADGAGFTYVQDLDLHGYGTTAPVALEDGRLRLYAFEQRKGPGNAVRSFVSTDAIHWEAEDGVRLQANGDEVVTDPFVVKWKGGWKMYFKTEPRAAGALKPRTDSPGPWDADVLVYRVSADGGVEKTATFGRAGVPTLARMKDGRLIVAHQNFPENDDAGFDRVAVRFSSDEGATWTAAETIRLEGLPDGMRPPFDPTLVPLPDGRVRLYFTSTKGRIGVPAIWSAVSKDGVAYAFEPGVRFAVEGRIVIDCAAALHCGTFHLFAPDNGEIGKEAGTRDGTGYHAVSEDGLAFTRVDDVRIEGRRRWLGNVQSDGKRMVFFGTGEKGWMWESGDGEKWGVMEAPEVRGADPGAIAAKGGGWVVVVTGPPRPGTPSERRKK